MNYNTSSGSQLMPEAWLERTGAEVIYCNFNDADADWTRNRTATYLEATQDEIEARGDFISLLSRHGPEKVIYVSTLKLIFPLFSCILNSFLLPKGSSRSIGEPLELAQRR